jgi:hypothetical protein
LKLGRRYGATLAIEGLLLGIAAVLMQRHFEAGSYFASAACRSAERDGQHLQRHNPPHDSSHRNDH